MFKKSIVYLTLTLGCLSAYADTSGATAAMTEIKSWTGSGANAATLTVHWGDGQSIDNLVSGVRFDGNTTAADVIASALKEDSRFYALDNAEGMRIAYGFDTNGDGSAAVVIGETTLAVTDGVAKAEDDVTGAKGSTDYDHWSMNDDSKSWKVYVNGNAADFNTTINNNDGIMLEYSKTTVSTPAVLPYVFYLRPASHQGAWMLPEVAMDATVSKSVDIPMIVNTVDRNTVGKYNPLRVEVYNVDGSINSNVANASVSNFDKGNVTAKLTLRNAAEELILKPYFYIAYGEPYVYGDIETKLTITLKKMESVAFDGYEPGATLNIDNMGILRVTPVGTPTDATFTGYAMTAENPAIVSLFKTGNNYCLVAHNPGTTKITLTSTDGGASTEYNVTVASPQPYNPEDQYADGTFWLNEEWFGHTSGSVNYVDENRDIHYRVYGNNNNNAAFGATSQFATIYADKMIVMSKQAWDGGDKREHKTGGRCVILNAKTMQRLASFDEVGGDGRSVVGVAPSKAYLGHAKGIRILDLENLTLAESDITDLTLSRNGQIGNMVKAGKYVYAANIGTGLSIIDTEKDSFIKTIANTKIQGVAVSLDGRVWMAESNKLYTINQETLEIDKEYSIPGSITCSSGSWRSQTLYALHNSNKLYWGSGTLYCWDLDNVEDPSTLTPVYTYEGKATYGSPYGTGAIDERTGTYMFCTMPGFGISALNNWLHFVNLENGEDKVVKMSEYWWFPAMPVLPDKHDPVLTNVESFTVNNNGEPLSVNLSEYLNDEDDHNGHIAVRSADIEDNNIAEVALEGKRLSITPKKEGQTNLNLQLESRGRVVTHTLPVEVTVPVGVSSVKVNCSIICRGSNIVVTGYNGCTFNVYNLAGTEVANFKSTGDIHNEHLNIGQGIYIVVASDGNMAKLNVR